MKIFGIDLNMAGSTLARGYLIEMAPGILAGAMQESLWRVQLKDLVNLVNNNENLWDRIPSGDQKNIIEFGPMLGPLEWFTAEWVMENGRQANPALYSALLSWPEGIEWLQVQILDIKLKLSGGT